MNNDRIVLVSLYPLDNFGGGEFLTLNTLKAVASTGAHCRLYTVRQMLPRPLPPSARRQVEFIRAFDSRDPGRPAAVTFSNLMADCADFDVVWVHQYLSNDLMFDLVSTVSSDQTLLMTSHGHEACRGVFSQLYQASPNHWCVEVSDFSSSRAAGYAKQRFGASAAVWRKDCENFKVTSRPFRRRACVVGRVLPHKGVEITVAGLPMDYELDVVGGLEHDGDYAVHLKKCAAGKRVNFLGTLDEAGKRRVLENSDVLVASSCLNLYDGKQIEQAELLGLVIIEAVAAGVLPITSDLPPFREVMEKLGLQEFIYPQRNPAALEKVLRRYESLTPDQQAELRQRAHDRMREHFLFDDLWPRIRKSTGFESRS